MASTSGMTPNLDSDHGEQLAQLQSQLSEQKLNNTQLSRQLIRVTDKLAEKDTQLLIAEGHKLELEKSNAIIIELRQKCDDLRDQCNSV